MRDPAVLAVQPRRLEVIAVPEAMSLADFDRRYPSTVDIDELARLNRLDRDRVVAPGTRLKRVVGGPGM